jgi:hypothetical protein
MQAYAVYTASTHIRAQRLAGNARPRPRKTAQM